MSNLDHKFYHRRHLPHYEIEGSVYFVTSRVHASRRQLPDAVLEAGFEISGHVNLTEPEIGETVSQVLLEADTVMYQLHSYVLMPDHMHLVIQPIAMNKHRYSLSSVMHHIKSITGFRINRIRGTKGKFWQHENFDRIIRSQREYEAALRYLYDNPLRSAIIEDPKDWRWFYLRGGLESYVRI